MIKFPIKTACLWFLSLGYHSVRSISNDPRVPLYPDVPIHKPLSKQVNKLYDKRLRPEKSLSEFPSLMRVSRCRMPAEEYRALIRITAVGIEWGFHAGRDELKGSGWGAGILDISSAFFAKAAVRSS